MNHYPDNNYHGYGRDASNMQGMAYGGYRDSPSGSHRGQPGPDYHSGSYPMAPNQVGSMYGHGGPYGMSPGYGHYSMSGHVGHHSGMMNPYYTSHERHPSYGHPQSIPQVHQHQHQHIGGIMGPAGQQNHPSLMGARGTSSAVGSDHYGGSYPGQGSPSRMSMQHSQVPVPPHPMRQSNTQQNPQEVADNILQMASSYPSNQTVQVPLKNRPAPYHIPRSPHCVPRPDLPQHGSPSPHQQQLSPAVSAHQTSPSPGSGIMSPGNHSTAPSPSAAVLRSPCGNQRPAFTGQDQSQTSHHTDSPNYSPCSMAQGPSYGHNPLHHRQPSMSSPCANNMPAPYVASSGQVGSGQAAYGHGHNMNMGGNNPLMSLEKLVMLPETQVVDPKSVVNDACLSSQSDEGPKNGDDPAEWPAESSGDSVGCSGLSSSLSAQAVATDASTHFDSSGGGQGMSCQSGQSATTSHHQSSTHTGCSGSDQPTSVTQKVDNWPQKGFHHSCPEAQLEQPPCRTDVPHTTNAVPLSQTVDTTEEGRENPTNIPSSYHTIPTRIDSSTFSGSGSGQIIDMDPADTAGNVFQTNCASSKSESVCVLEERPISHNSSPALTSQESNTSLTDSVANSNHSSMELSASDMNIVHSESGEKGTPGQEQVGANPPNSSHTDSLCMPESKVLGLHDSRCGESQIEEIPKRDSHCALPQTNEEHLKQEALVNRKTSAFANISQSESQGKLSENILRTKQADLPLIPPKKGKEDMKVGTMPCRPPGVLSEVPVISNGVEGDASCVTHDDLELDCSDSVPSKVHNGLGSVVKSKLGYSRRATHLSTITPCSIAVGASERAVCERFALRRNCVGRVTRTSSMRLHSDSAGNTDSDESLENISTALLLSKDPQDGSKKRGPGSSSKRNGLNKSASVMVSSSIKSAENRSSGPKTIPASNGCTPHKKNSGSDEEMCYYEGVDNNYDMFINTMSSEESEASGDENGCSNQHNSKAPIIPDAQESVASTAQPCDTSEKPNDLKDEIGSKSDAAESSSPPAKKLKESPPATSLNESHSLKESSVAASLTESHTPPRGSVGVIDLTAEVSSPDVKKETISPSKNNVRGCEKFRPSILGRRTPVVVINKSNIVSPRLVSVKSETECENPNIISHSEGNIPQQLGCASLPDVKVESTESPSLATEVSDPCKDTTAPVKAEVPDSKSSISSPIKKKSTKRPAKKKGSKSKGKGKVTNKNNRQSEVKDSFKSMKFSRTLDMIKANKRKDASNIGPFVRVVGNRCSPKTVSVFAQPTSETLAAAKQGKLGGVSGRKSQQGGGATVTTFHMVSNHLNQGPPLVPSTRTISQKPWVCAFCGHQSSYKMLGDLFGPYFKENEVSRAEKIAQEESKKIDSKRDHKPQDTGKKGSTPSGSSNKSHNPSGATTSTPKNHRRKPVLSPRAGNDETDAPPEELWTHLACALWCPGVCLVGNKMYGLEEGVKDAAENVCSVCKFPGAMLGCFHKGCPMKYHFVCAAEKDCYMNEENFSVLCPKHKDKKISIASAAKS